MATIERTGKVWGISASEFRIVFDDGREALVWSGVWHDDEPEVEERKVMEFATLVRYWEDRGWTWSEEPGRIGFYKGGDYMDREQAGSKKESGYD